MAGKYWIKLYHEILDDPKLGSMPDHLWRRTIELFLIAGEFDADGWLPKIKDMAWRLRTSEDELTTSLRELISSNIVNDTGNGYVVTNFAIRQEAMSPAERMRRQRNEEPKKAACYESVTNRNENCYESVTKSNTDKIRIDKITDKIRSDNKDNDKSIIIEVFETYQSEIGNITSLIETRLVELINQYNAVWVLEAIKQSSVSNVKKLSYVIGILKTWKAKGYKIPAVAKKQTDELTPEVWRKVIMENKQKQGELSK